MSNTPHLSRQILSMALAGLMTVAMFLGTDGLARHYEAAGAQQAQGALAASQPTFKVGGVARRGA